MMLDRFAKFLSHSDTHLVMLSLSDKEKPVWENYEDYQYLEVAHTSEFVLHVQLNRPGKRNSVNRVLWSELEDCFKKLSIDPNCRAIILSGIGPGFCAGIDFSGMKSMAGGDGGTEKVDVARKAWKIRRNWDQDLAMLKTIANCPKPVMAAVHGACLGIAVGIMSQCDIRYATEDAFFSIKKNRKFIQELDLGFVDGGALPRLVKKIGNASALSELALTARNFSAKEALDFGMVSEVFGCQDEMMQEVYKLADLIASKSPVAVQGTKVTLNYARDHTVDQSLDYVVRTMVDNRIKYGWLLIRWWVRHGQKYLQELKSIPFTKNFCVC